MVRKDLPYLVVSLAAHAGLLVLLLLWRLPPEPEPLSRRVLLEFRRAAPSRVLPPAAPRAAGLPAHPRKEMPGLRVPEGGRLATPPAAGAPAEPARRATALPEIPRLPGASPRVPEATGGAALPSPDQILRALAGNHRAEPAAAIGGGADGAAPAVETAAGPAAALEPAGYIPTTALEWKAGGRTLLLRPRLAFPVLLLEKGLEVDVEAAFIVAPSGQVTRIEITRSSGFASVDREVEQALRDALFAESSQEDSGRIQFRFRLERKQ
jgi:TonB family protein